MSTGQKPEVVGPYVADKPDDKRADASDAGIATPVMAVFAILIVIVLIYYTATCFGVSKTVKVKKVEGGKDAGGFDIFAEVEKLRRKQDEYKAGTV